MIYPRPHPAEFAIDAPDSEIKPFEAWSRGLGIAFDETNGLPEMEGLNGLFQAITKYIKYLEQNGFAEWSSTLEYPVGAGVRVGAVWYRAKTQNTGKNPINNQSDWEVFLNAATLLYANPLLVNGNIISVRDSTTSQKGVTRYATPQEVANRSNVSAAVRPSDIPQPAGIPNASTTIIGVSRFANTTEVNNKSSAMVAVNPANVATIAQSTDLGVGQTWKNLTGSRALGTTYQNPSDKPIMVSISLADTDSRKPTITINVGGVNILVNTYDQGSNFGSFCHSFIVPGKANYRISSSTINTIEVWAELS